MKKNIYKIIALVSTSILFLAGCSSEGESVADGDNGGSDDQMTFGVIFKSTGNPFGEKAMEGFVTAIEEQGHEAVTKAPDQPNAEQQITMIQELIDQGVDGIVISANDPDALQPVLQSAMNQGIAVVTFDSSTNAESRDLHIQQADATGIAQVLADATLDLAGGEGDYAILSATSTATNQNAWIDEMASLMNEDSTFENLNLARVAYGDDLRDKSTSETEGLLQSFPDLKVIVAPSTVALAAAAKVVEDQGLSDDIKVTGLGLPSEMADYINSGITPYMYLWNPIDMGYMAGYAVVAVANGEISGETGESFDAGELGQKDITEASDGGTESILGEPFRFDQDNIEEWQDIY